MLLSGADYPIKPASRIINDLNLGQYDVHIQHILIQPNRLETEWRRLCYERYFTKKIRFPRITKRLRLTRSTLNLNHPLLVRPFLPFTPRFRCYAGALWFCGNRRAADYLIEFHSTRRRLARHCKTVKFADEMYFQSILANAPHLTLNDYNYRYVDWSIWDAHPKTLGMDDLPNLLASLAHFARKFDINREDEVLDVLDTITDE